MLGGVCVRGLAVGFGLVSPDQAANGSQVLPPDTRFQFALAGSVIPVPVHKLLHVEGSTRCGPEIVEYGAFFV
ncbi:Uncharacterised protein [Mycobacteroides abscessus subsp. abscessus]|nr:Uncharacterised protein [Mycobacteroides abscessus subsp. abscessus]